MTAPHTAPDGIDGMVQGRPVIRAAPRTKRGKMAGTDRKTSPTGTTTASILQRPVPGAPPPGTAVKTLAPVASTTRKPVTMLARLTMREDAVATTGDTPQRWAIP